VIVRSQKSWHFNHNHHRLFFGNGLVYSDFPSWLASNREIIGEMNPPMLSAISVNPGLFKSLLFIVQPGLVLLDSNIVEAGLMLSRESRHNSVCHVQQHMLKSGLF